MFLHLLGTNAPFWDEENLSTRQMNELLNQYDSEKNYSSSSEKSVNHNNSVSDSPEFKVEVSMKKSVMMKMEAT